MAVVALAAMSVIAACGTQREPAAPQELGGREAARIHAQLEQVGRACTPRGVPAAKADRLAWNVDSLIAKSRRYPTQRFQIHDETGSMVSALLVIRQELLTCDRRLAKRVERMLPQRVRAGLGRARGG